MSQDKKSFILYVDWLKEIENLSYIEAGTLFKNILQFVNGEDSIISDTENYHSLYYAITEQIVYEWSKFNPANNKYHWNYKGGISTENHIIRNSEYYRDWRNAVFERDNYTCIKCNQRGGIIHAHHIKLFSEYPALRFDINNGLTLCKKCHINEHKK